MELFDVYSIFDLELTKGSGSYVWDKAGNKYLDLYGGHAVISIGHSHPVWVKKLCEQAANLGYYSNSVINPLQKEFAQLLGKVSGCESYNLFMANSGAEANENAIKLASYHTGRKKIVAIKGAFHGRTSGTLTCTDYPKMRTPFNESDLCFFIEQNDLKGLEEALKNNDVAAFIIEGIQGVGGGYMPGVEFFKEAKALCSKYGALMIADEVQSGYGRTGKFFAFQHAGIEPDLITIGKGMGNGFPVAGVLIHPKIAPEKGLLGTTYGGNHLACAAAIAVLEVIEKENLIANAIEMGGYLQKEVAKLSADLKVYGKGLMVMIEKNEPVVSLRKSLLDQYHIFTGASAKPNVLRILPPLSIKKTEIDFFVKNLSAALLNNIYA